MTDKQPLSIWITGCSGFLGSRLAGALSKAGHNVVGLSRRGCAGASRSVNIDLSLGTSSANLQSLLSASGTPDVVIHAAAKQPGPTELSTFFDSNVRSAAHLTEALRNFAPKQLIYTSTLSVYGRRSSLPVSEQNPAGGTLPYGATKRWAEQLFENLRSRSRVVVLRLPSLYGAGQEDSFIDGLARSAIKGKPIELFSRGELVRDALHVTDVMKAIDSCIGQEATPGFSILNLGCGRPIKTVEYARELIRALHSSSAIIPIDREASHFNLYADISEARKQLGFEPMPLAESMNLYASELRASS